jgi:hypothetical protein
MIGPMIAIVRRRQRAGTSRHPLLLAVGLLLVLAGTLLPAWPAQAHVPIVLLILAPKADQTVGSDTTVRVLAQRTLGGVDQVAFTPTIDGRPLDPTTGRATTRPVPVLIHAGQTLQLPLRGLSAGQHVATVTYRPDRDAPVMRNTVSFGARGSPGHLPLVAALAALAAALLGTGGAAAVLLTRRRRRPRPAEEPTTPPTVHRR